MAQLALRVESMEAPNNKLLTRIGLKKEKDTPLGTVEVLIDPETEDEQSLTLRPQQEAHLIPLKPGRHLVAVYDPDREKHVQGYAKAGGIISGLTGFLLGAELGGSQSTMDLISKGASKVIVGDAAKRWEKAFKRYSVKEFEVQEGETVSYRCEMSREHAGIVNLDEEGKFSWHNMQNWVMKNGLPISLFLLGLTLVESFGYFAYWWVGIPLIVAGVAIIVLKWRKNKQKKQGKQA